MEYGLYMKHCKVEVYLLEFKLCVHPKLNEHVVKSFSRADTVGEHTVCTCTCMCMVQGMQGVLCENVMTLAIP